MSRIEDEVAQDYQCSACDARAVLSSDHPALADGGPLSCHVCGETMVYMGPYIPEVLPENI